MSLSRALSSLGARFDSEALVPPADASPAIDQALQARHPAAWQVLQTWCHDNAGASTAGMGWKPASGGGLLVAALLGPADELPAWANSFARMLDGSTRLAQLPRRSALAWRGQVKFNDAVSALSGRPRPADDPWDAGWASTAPPTLRRLSGQFMPRRATLILADAADSAALMLAAAGLVQRGQDSPHPMRWLWVGAPADNLPPAVRPRLTVWLDGSSAGPPAGRSTTRPPRPGGPNRPDILLP